MTSSNKKKAARRDFKKPKSGLGKKLIPQNATKTDHSAKTIVLSAQSIGVVKEGVPRTRKNQTLDDLLPRLTHNAANVRIDSLTGLQELNQAHPALFVQGCSSVLQNCIRLLTDENTGVRKALFEFLTRLLYQVPLTNLLPSVDLLVAATLSAISSIHQEVRLDALRMIDVLLDLVPERITEGWPAQSKLQSAQSFGSQFLQAILSLLHIRSAQSNPTLGSISQLSLVNKSKVFATLAHFIHIALGKLQIDDSCWFYASAFKNETTFNDFARGVKARLTADEDTLQLQNRNVGFQQWVAPNLHYESGSMVPLSSLTLAFGSEATVASTGWTLAELTLELASHLRSTYIDAATFQSSAEYREALLLNAMQIARNLWRATLLSELDNIQRAKVLDALEKFLKMSSAYFPAKASLSVHFNAQSMNLDALHCQMIALLLSQHERAQSVLAQALLKQAQAFISNCLASSFLMSVPKEFALQDLLPVLWITLRGSQTMTDRSDTLEEMFEFWDKGDTLREHKTATFLFLCNLLLAEAQSDSLEPFPSWSTQEQTVIKKLMLRLPRDLFSSRNEQRSVALVFNSLASLLQVRVPIIVETFADEQFVKHFQTFVFVVRGVGGRPSIHNGLAVLSGFHRQLALSIAFYSAQPAIATAVRQAIAQLENKEN